nr:MAG TPA: hypothetical protein [Caudoviricetes sp.]
MFSGVQKLSINGNQDVKTNQNQIHITSSAYIR